MNELMGQPMDRESGFHPSIFQNPAIWAQRQTDATRAKIDRNTAAKVQQSLRGSGFYCTVNSSDERSPLLFAAFLSAPNLDTLDLMIRAGIRQSTGFKVGRQSRKELIEIMERVYDEHARNCDELLQPWCDAKACIRKEVARLNCLVAEKALREADANVRSHLKYLQDAQNPPPILPMPQYTSPAGLLPMGPLTR
jgi:hypothetical protein